MEIGIAMAHLLAGRLGYALASAEKLSRHMADFALPARIRCTRPVCRADSNHCLRSESTDAHTIFTEKAQIVRSGRETDPAQADVRQHMIVEGIRKRPAFPGLTTAFHDAH
jgi:hypothetical protein